MVHQHFLLVTFPAQGHINPALQFAKRLQQLGVHVTFVTTTFALRRMVDNQKCTSASPTDALMSFADFSDGYDDGKPDETSPQLYMSELRRRSLEALPQLIKESNAASRPVTCLIYSILLPWAGDVASRLHIPSALLWIQPATILGIYYHYFNGYAEIIKESVSNSKCNNNNNNNNPSDCAIKLPGLSLVLTTQDLPSHFVSTPFALPSFKEHLEVLSKETNPKVLVNSFDALEPEALKAIDHDKLNLIGIGPLIPSAFLDGKDPTDTSFGGDLFSNSTHPSQHSSCDNDYVKWLNSKPKTSVVYVSFGSTSVLPKRQTEEMVKGLLDSGLPFLWVVRVEEKEKKEDDDNVILSYKEELEKRGLIVPWCSQVEVLSHPSVGCFLTHCGWNSSLESLVSGVPVVAFPQWADQPTNAKMIKDEWKIGVRMAANQQGIVEGFEIKKCIEMVMGNEEMRNNAKKWKELAIEAVMENGSSDKNLKCFVHELEEQNV